MGSWAVLHPGLNLPWGPLGFPVAPERWGSGHGGPRAGAAGCCQACPPSACTSPLGVHIPLWLNWLSVCDRLQASGHGASPSVLRCHQRPHPRFACRRGLLAGLCGAVGSGQSQL